MPKHRATAPMNRDVLNTRRAGAVSAPVPTTAALHRIAFEAVVWGMPIVSVDAMRRAYRRDAKARDHDIVYFSRPADSKLQLTTPNASSHYVYFNFNTQHGPVVLEVPAAKGAGLFGSILDAWQVPLTDIGPAGADEGKGGKYLLLPPGYRGAVPAGVIPIRLETLNGYACFRAIPEGSSATDVENALALVKRLRLYRHADLEHPPEQRFIDMAGKPFDGIVRFDTTFYESLARMVDEEPALVRDSAMLTRLKGLGIEKGKVFTPDTAMQTIVSSAARDAQHKFMSRAPNDGKPFWSDREWRWPNPIGGETGFTFEKDGEIDLEARAIVYFLACAPPAKLGKATAYLTSFVCAAGQPLSGEHIYHLHVPADVPARQFWAVTVYDAETAAFIRASPRVEINSYDRGLQRNPDGSLDLTFGPASEGGGPNWIPTVAGRKWFTMFRLYGPEPALLDRTWKLPDIAKDLGAPATGRAWQRAPHQREQELYEIVKDAYVYAYPLVLNDVTRRQLTNFAEPTGIPGQGPVNRFSHSPAFPTPDFRGVIRANVDTLYSVAWLDLGPEPLVLSVPATDRYFLLQMSSLWTDVFAVPGTRTTGRSTARTFLLVGPRWLGEVPIGLELIRSPTRFAAIAGRTQTNGVADYGSVHEIQQRYQLTPVSAWHVNADVQSQAIVDPSLDMKTPPPIQVEQMNAETFFARFADLLNDNPPGPHDYPMIHRLERIGFGSDRSFDLSEVSAEIRQTFERAVADGKALVAELGRQAAGESTRGWEYTTTGGAYGVNYAYRAAIAKCALGLNLAQDAVYPSAATDGEGRPLDGKRRYTLRFEADKLPPVAAFWSVTAYDKDGYLILNALNRQALGDRDALAKDTDGSVTLYIQAEAPDADKVANWLPVAREPFTLLLRLYSPKSEVLDGSWRPPLVSMTSMG